MQRLINGNKIDELSVYFFLWKIWGMIVSAFLVSSILDKRKGGISGNASKTKPTV